MSSILKLVAAAGLSLTFVAAPALAQKAAAPGPIAKACMSEAKKYCPKAKGEEEIKTCLADHTQHMGKKCKKAYEDGR